MGSLRSLRRGINKANIQPLRYFTPALTSSVTIPSLSASIIDQAQLLLESAEKVWFTLSSDVLALKSHLFWEMARIASSRQISGLIREEYTKNVFVVSLWKSSGAPTWAVD
jgi:hypothetical protein